MNVSYFLICSYYACLLWIIINKAIYVTYDYYLNKYVILNLLLGINRVREDQGSLKLRKYMTHQIMVCSWEKLGMHRLDCRYKPYRWNVSQNI